MRCIKNRKLVELLRGSKLR